ncbi:MAG: helix-turn-helix domain-containing protein [Actinomycetota bacterium]
MSDSNLPRLAYTVNEAAEVLRCSRGHIYRLIERGHLDRVKIGRRTLIRASEIERILTEGTDSQGT